MDKYENGENPLKKRSVASANKKRKNRRRKRNTVYNVFTIILSAIAVLLVIAIATLAGGYFYVDSLLNAVEKVEKFEEEEVGITEENKQVFDVKNVTNIALFGIDTRTDSTSGRSDAIMILTIDEKHNKIKLSSIARDSYVNIEGRGKDKINHAYSFGGAKLAIKTINQTFGMNITDYVSVNFFGIVSIIDKIGGVTIHVDNSEKSVMNQYYIPELNRIGIPCEYISKTGTLRLTGAQALAYSRNRYTGGDLSRTDRQKEILTAMFDEVKKMNVSKYPDLVKHVLSHVETTLDNSEILSHGMNTVTNSYVIETFNLPTEACNPNSGKDAYINGVWYYIYNLDTAKKELHQFINEN